MKHTFRNFSMPLSNVVLSMGLKGVLVDQTVLRELRVTFEKERFELNRKYRQLVHPHFNIVPAWKGLMQALKAAKAKDIKLWRKLKPNRTAMRKVIKTQLNPGSHKRQAELFYTIWKLPVQKNWKTKKITADEEAILKLLKKKEAKNNLAIKDLLLLILELRGIAKKISTYCLEEEETSCSKENLPGSSMQESEN